MEKNVAQKKSQKFSNPYRSIIAYNTKSEIQIAGWIKKTITDLGWLIDLTTLRILGFLFEKKGHTIAKIVAVLNVSEGLICEKLEWLRKQDLIHDEHIAFGVNYYGRRRTIHIYQLSELGRFLLHQIAMQFPGLWMTIKGTEAEICKYNK